MGKALLISASILLSFADAGFADPPPGMKAWRDCEFLMRQFENGKIPDFPNGRGNGNGNGNIGNGNGNGNSGNFNGNGNIGNGNGNGMSTDCNGNGALSQRWRPPRGRQGWR